MNDSSWLAATFESKPRPWMVSASVPLLLVAGAHAARAHDALARIEGEIRIRLVLRRVEMVRALVAVAHLAQADDARHVLQLAVAVGGAGEAVERMIRDVELHHAAPDVGELLVLRVYFHALRHRRGARGGQPLHAVDLHQAHAAGAEGFQLLGGAELRNLDVGERRGAHHRSSLRNGDLAAVDA
jgi:hypothetical protein